MTKFFTYAYLKQGRFILSTNLEGDEIAIERAAYVAESERTDIGVYKLIGQAEYKDVLEGAKNQIEFEAACVEAVKLAEENGKKYYVYRATSGGFMTSHQYTKGWLFEVYPGGRRVFSAESHGLTSYAFLDSLG